VHDVEADVTPNLAQVAPGAYQLPPVSGPVAGLPKDKRLISRKNPFP